MADDTNIAPAGAAAPFGNILAPCGMVLSVGSMAPSFRVSVVGALTVDAILAAAGILEMITLAVTLGLATWLMVVTVLLPLLLKVWLNGTRVVLPLGEELIRGEGVAEEEEAVT